MSSRFSLRIAEVDARRLYAREASSSMFKYCVDVLHLSEAEACLRIAAARGSRQHPALLTMLDDGRLHLSGIAVLAPHLTDTNCEELLARATHKTKRELLVLVAEIAPKPDVSPSIRKLPKQRQNPASEHRTSGAESTLSGKSNPALAPAPEVADKPPVVEPLAPSRYKVQFTASAELHDKLQRLAALMPGADLASILEASVTEKLERLEARRLGKVENPRKSLEDADTTWRRWTTAKTRWSGTDVPPTGLVNRSRRFHSFRTEFKKRRPFVLPCNSQRRTAPHPEPFSSSRPHKGQLMWLLLIDDFSSQDGHRYFHIAYSLR